MATAATSDIGRGELVGRAGKIDPGANFGDDSGSVAKGHSVRREKCQSGGAGRGRVVTGLLNSLILLKTPKNRGF